MKLANSGGTIPVYTVSGPSSRSLPDWLVRQKKKSLKHDPEFANRVELLQDFEFTDYSKSIHLQEDRSIEFHTPAGCHYRVRIPRFGRDIVYDKRTAEVLVPAVGLDADGFGEVFRLNLELGRFQKSFQIELSADDGVEKGLQGSIGVGCVNTAAIAEESHGLSAFGTSLGTVEFWDPRSRARVATLQSHDGEITALDFSKTGLSLTTGSSAGIVQIYDLRHPVPILTKDLGFGYAVKNLMHLTTSSFERKILAADKKSIRIFDPANGEQWTSIEPEVDINCVAHCPDSGMLLSANEGRQQHAWFIPMLGPAPRWCAFLERMVDEMAEEVSTTTYENYKFLTLPELRSFSLDHLVGKTNLLRPYMHGFFVASKLYDQARLIANPYVYEEERLKRVKEKIDKERKTRVTGHKMAKVKVNQKLADRLLKKQQKKGKVGDDAVMAIDDRLKDIYEDEDFVVDETSAEFRALNASTVVEATGKKKRPSDMDSNMSSEGDDDDDDDDVARHQPTRPAARASAGSAQKKDVVMRVSSSQNRGARSKDASFGSLARKAQSSRDANPGGGLNRTRRTGVVGERQVTFVPESGKKKEEAAASQEAAPQRRDNKARRSASGNTFRNMK